jgi:hypothetical protein
MVFNYVTKLTVVSARFAARILTRSVVTLAARRPAGAAANLASTKKAFAIHAGTTAERVGKS